MTAAPSPHPDERLVLAELGEDGLARLVSAFYRRVEGDDLLGPMYAAHLETTGETLADAEARLRGFLVFRFGGSRAYVEERGHPRLRMRHMPFAIDARGAERWLMLMRAAMGEVQVPDGAARALWPYFEQTARFMINR